MILTRPGRFVEYGSRITFNDVHLNMGIHPKKKLSCQKSTSNSKSRDKHIQNKKIQREKKGNNKIGNEKMFSSSLKIKIAIKYGFYVHKICKDLDLQNKKTNEKINKSNLKYVRLLFLFFSFVRFFFCLFRLFL